MCSFSAEEVVPFVNKNPPAFKELEANRIHKIIKRRAATTSNTPAKGSSPLDSKRPFLSHQTFDPRTGQFAYATTSQALAVSPSQNLLERVPKEHPKPASPGVQHTACSVVQKMAVRDDGQEGVVAESESEDIRFNKQFYFLHIKIQSAQAGALLFWRFDVIIVDTTEEDHPSHTFHNLRVNDTMHIVFHEPFDCVMSPVDDIPWVQSVDQLYISPQRMKVVDTSVFYGPSEQVPEPAGA